MESVAFIGSWDLEDDDLVRSWLSSMVSFLYDCGARHFYVGCVCAFDSVAASVTIRLCEEHPDVRIHRVYSPKTPLASRLVHDECNRWMIDRADAIVVYDQQLFGCLTALLCQAQEQGKPLFSYFPAETPPAL